MALLLMDGFDHVTAAGMITKGWSLAPGAMGSPGRFGGQASRTGGTSVATPKKFLPVTCSTMIIGFALQYNIVPASEYLFLIAYAGANAAVKVVLLNSGKIKVTNLGNTQVVISTSSLLPNTWNYVEVKVVVNGASGSAAIRINGHAEAGPTTGNFGSVDLDSLMLYMNALSPALYTYIDDLYVCDATGSAPLNDFLGDVRVQTLMPTADGASTAWAASAGADYTCVDEAQANGDTDYISTSTPGDKDTFVCGDLATATGTVFAVQINNQARKDDAGTRTICPVIRQGGVDYDGATSAALGASFVNYSQIYENDPTGAAWTIANVDADEFGVKLVA